jgi:hypothetical protein
MRRGQPHRTAEGTRIRKAAACYDILLTCNEKLRKQDIWRPDVRHALKTCSVTESYREGQEWRRTIRGSDREGGEIFLVVTLDADQRLIVVFEGWRKEGSQNDDRG